MTVCPAALALADKVGLVLGQDLGVDRVHADLRGDGLGGLAVVAGHHDDVCKAAVMQGTDGVLRLAAQRIKNADDGGELARDAEIEMGILCRAGTGTFHPRPPARAALVLKDEVRAADDDLFVVDLAGDAVRHDILHLGMVFLVVQAARFLASSTTAFAIECG